MSGDVTEGGATGSREWPLCENMCVRLYVCVNSVVSLVDQSCGLANEQHVVSSVPQSRLSEFIIAVNSLAVCIC